MLIFEEGFEGCSLGFTHSARWAAVGTATLDDTVAAPGSRASLSLFSGAPGNAFTQSGVERAWTGHTRPSRLRFHVRLAERQLAKAFVLLCQNDAGDDGEHVAVWLYCSGNERRHTAEQGRIGLLGQDGFFLSTPYEADRWHEVEVYLDWTRKSLRLAVDGVVVVEDGGGENEVSFRDRSVDGVSVLRLCNKDVAQVWFDSVSLSDDADAPAAPPPPPPPPPPPTPPLRSISSTVNLPIKPANRLAQYGATSFPDAVMRSLMASTVISFSAS